MIPKIRCSSLDKILTCTGSPTLEALLGAAIVDDGGHAVQWAGSWCHHHSARRLRDEFGAIGEPDPLTIPETFQPSGYDEWVVEWYVNRVTRLVPSNWATFIEREVKRVFPLPRPVTMTDPTTGQPVLVTHFELTGHIDHSAVSPCRTQAIIDDLKRGYEVVDAAEFNWQVAGYCALLEGEIPTLTKALLRIHQPAAPERTTEAPVTNIKALVSALVNAVNVALEKPYTLTTGKACKYCKAAVARVGDKFFVCPTLKKDLLTMQETLTKDMIDSLANFADLQDFGELTSHVRKLQYPSKRLIDTFKAALEAAGGKAELKDGTIAQIIEEEGPRKIADVQTAHEQLSGRVGIHAAWKTLEMSIGSVEEQLVAAGMQKTSKKPGVENAKGWIEQNLTVTRKPQKTLVFV